jgi:oligoendopeptidase F
MDKQNKDIPDFSSVERAKVPVAHTWKTEDIYPDFAAWEQDKTALNDMIGKIDGLASRWLDSPQNMLQSLKYVDQVNQTANRLWIYAHLQSDTEMTNSFLQAKKGEIQRALVELETRQAFMEPDILKLGEEKIQEYLGLQPELEIYRHYFETVLRLKPHILPTDKEQIVTQTQLFTDGPEKAAQLLNDVDMPAPRITLASGERVSLNWSSYERLRGSAERQDRAKVMKTFWRNHAQFQNTQAAMLDTTAKSHLFFARVHHYRNCLEAALYPHNINPDVYHNLIGTVEQNLSPLHRYMRLKARLLKLDRPTYSDIYASSVPAVERLFTLQETEALILEALKPLGDEYIQILKQGFRNRWLDLYPNKGKLSGAYSKGNLYGGHPYILMNYNGKFNHLTTLAHEFGHALHSYFSNRDQPYPTARYPTFLAEIASTFNEVLLIRHLIEIEKNDLFKLFILDQYLDEFRGALYRQTLFAHFELAMHREVETGGTLTPDWLNQQYLTLTRRYYGHDEGIIRVEPYIQNEWSSVPHFYYNFYVYQYSTGIAASTTLAEMVLNGGSAEQEKYLNMLKAGGSRYPLDTLKEAGIDLTTPAPIETAIRTIERWLGEMERIAGKLKL